MKNRRPLAQSEHYLIRNEYEAVLLERDGRDAIKIGDFYGDPQVAMIDWNERWCLVGGCGLILYRLQEPSISYEYEKEGKQWFEIHRAKPDQWWVEALYQVDDDIVRIIVDPNSAAAGLYELYLPTLSIRRLLGPQDNA